jgi:hypothetical protein
MAEAAVLDSVESELLTPAVIENAIESLFVQASAPASELADRRASCFTTGEPPAHDGLPFYHR